MIVYESDVKGFRADVLSNRIEEEIHSRFKKVLRRSTTKSEVKSWKDSLGYQAKPAMFVVKVVGESMNRVIPNGSWCLFRANPPERGMRKSFWSSTGQSTIPTPAGTIL